LAKHIKPFYEKNNDMVVSNQIKNYSDSWDINKIIDNIEILVSSQSGFTSAGKGPRAIAGNTTGKKIQGNYGNAGEGITKAVIFNHALDYFLKLYLKSTIGISADDDNFLIDPSYNNVTSNSSDMIDHITKVKNSIVLAHAETSTQDATQEMLSRLTDIVKHAGIYTCKKSVEKASKSISCFDRVFSILINEKDFILQDNEEENKILFGGQKFSFTPYLQFNPESVRPSASTRSASSSKAHYVNSLNDPGKANIYTFAISIGLLKRW
jgi:hypothetical protein